MDKTTKKCIVWAVVCFFVAAGIQMLWPLFITSGGDSSWDPNLFSGVLQPLLSLLQGAAMSIGGALVGAAVVIHWLTSRASVTKGASSHLS
ncbi:hypothetical protein [Nesterenkonia sp. Act20]|uniref:hypothetical protein n=1 Tax=Nesterenkonia sp. Act20 TaxID=1483432 RepID=UPI001C46F0A0|nr:hypothetical protein [Nesterenkonia sp. Act20]